MATLIDYILIALDLKERSYQYIMLDPDNTRVGIKVSLLVHGDHQMDYCRQMTHLMIA